MLPLALFAIGQAMSLLQNIINGQTTAEYRKSVMTALEEIQQVLATILEKLDKLMKKGDLNAMREAMKEADADITTMYNRPEFQAFLATGTPVRSDSGLPDQIRANVKNDLTALHEAMIGQGLESVEKPWLQLWVDAYRGETSTSAVEAAFQVFYGYMLAVQVRGLALLSAINEIDGWDEILRQNFKAQGAICQQVIDGLPDADRWTGLTAGAVDHYDCTTLKRGGWAGVPDGNVVVAVKFSEDRDRNLLLRVWYAPLLPPNKKAPSLGFVDTGNIAYHWTGGEVHDFDVYDRSDIRVHQAYTHKADMYVNITPLEVPDGDVIVDVTINFWGDEWERDGNTWKVGYMDLSIKHAPLDADGSLGPVSILRDTSPRSTSYPWSPLDRTRFDCWFSNPPGDVRAWNTPATGIRLEKDGAGNAFLSCAYAIHRQSYGSPQPTLAVWGVGTDGHVYRRDGSSWSEPNSDARLKQVSVSKQGGPVWGLGPDGRVLRWNGASWDEPNAATKLDQISNLGGDNLWGIGSDGRILQWVRGGSSWTPFTPSVQLKQISVGTADNIWGLTSDDRVLKYNSGTQKWDEPNLEARLGQIDAWAGEGAWGSGDSIKLRVYQTTDGLSWDQPDPDVGLYPVSGVDALNAWGVDAKNRVLQTQDGGKSWREPNPGSQLSQVSMGYE